MRVEIDWNGWAVGENRRLGFSKKLGRNYPNSAYQQFLSDISWTLRLAANKARIGQLRNARVDFLVDSRLDVDALVKPVLDAVQRSSIVINDAKVVHQSSDRADLRHLDDWKGPRVGPHYIRLVVEGEPV